jgi:hypothetical protein
MFGIDVQNWRHAPCRRLVHGIGREGARTVIEEIQSQVMFQTAVQILQSTAINELWLLIKSYNVGLNADLQIRK